MQKEVWKTVGVRATISVRVFYTSIFTLKAYFFFSILHINFYKILTSVHLLCHLFYLNNQFSQFFYYFPQLTPIHTRALSLSIPIFSKMLLSLYTHLSISIPIFESTLPLGLNPHHLSHKLRSTPSRSQASWSQAQAPISVTSSDPHHLGHKHLGHNHKHRSRSQAPISLAP